MGRPQTCGVHTRGRAWCPCPCPRVAACARQGSALDSNLQAKGSAGPSPPTGPLGTGGRMHGRQRVAQPPTGPRPAPPFGCPHGGPGRPWSCPPAGLPGPTCSWLRVSGQRSLSRLLARSFCGRAGCRSFSDVLRPRRPACLPSDLRAQDRLGQGGSGQPVLLMGSWARGHTEPTTLQHMAAVSTPEPGPMAPSPQGAQCSGSRRHLTKALARGAPADGAWPGKRESWPTGTLPTLGRAAAAAPQRHETCQHPVAVGLWGPPWASNWPRDTRTPRSMMGPPPYRHCPADSFPRRPVTWWRG